MTGIPPLPSVNRGGGGVVTTTLGDRRGRVGGGNGTHRLRPPFHGGIFLQVPGEFPIGVRRRLGGGDSELAEGVAEMGAVVAGAWLGGGGCADVDNVLHRGGLGGATLQAGVVGHVPADW